MHGYVFTAAALLLALAVYVWTVLKVGQARGKHRVDAPAVTGPPEFERTLRAQQNSVEQMVLFLPLLFLAWLLWGDAWSGAYGLVWSLGRILYVDGYVRAAAKRSTGFLLSGGVSFGILVALAVTLVLRAF